MSARGEARSSDVVFRRHREQGKATVPLSFQGYETVSQVTPTMIPNAGFWARYFRQFHIRRVEAFRTAALDKVERAFSGIAEEADAAAEAEFDRLGSMPADLDGSIDLGDLADWATERGIEYYETMLAVRQGMVNLLAVGLHHLFEQQQLFFLRRELAQDEHGTLKPTDLEKHLPDYGIDCRSFTCAGKLQELRWAANTIKHAAGPSAKKLARERPDLFENPVLSRAGWQKGEDARAQRAVEIASSSPFAPLAGEDLFVSEHDLTEWSAAVIAYWEALSAILAEQQQQATD